MLEILAAVDESFDTSNGAAGLETAFHCARAARGLPPVPFPPPPK